MLDDNRLTLQSENSSATCFETRGSSKTKNRSPVAASFVGKHTAKAITTTNPPQPPINLINRQMSESLSQLWRRQTDDYWQHPPEHMQLFNTAPPLITSEIRTPTTALVRH
jgi:hypothetical protein